MTRAFLLLALLLAAFTAKAQTAWPEYIHGLVADFSDSAVPAALPADVRIVQPDDSLPAARKRWSGTWQGWACYGRACDVKVAVERVDAKSATVIYAGASATSVVVHRGEAEFVGEELHLRVPTGARIAMRLRSTGDMELSVWRPDTQLIAAGVLTQRPLDAVHQRVVEHLATPWTHDGKPVALRLVVYRPKQGTGPWPTLVVNHGSTGNGDRPEVFGLVGSEPELARVFTQQGWQVVFPQRRGRGGSGGLYDEGFLPDRSRYACEPQYAVPGFDRALEDVHLVMQHVVARPDVATDRVLLGGVSRGGILATAYAGQYPQHVKGVINFVGGWMGERCPREGHVNPVLFRRGAAYARPTLWLYGSRDSFYTLAHSRANFEAFRAAGGQGRFVAYEMAPGQNGHFIAGRPDLWQADVEAYVRSAVAP